LVNVSSSALRPGGRRPKNSVTTLSPVGGHTARESHSSVNTPEPEDPQILPEPTHGRGAKPERGIVPHHFPTMSGCNCGSSCGCGCQSGSSCSCRGSCN